ncbi:hypothetical protein AAG906_001704 [Vitis piasezkii]
MGSELSTLGFFCNGRPPDLVKYRLAGGFGGAGCTGGGFGLDGEGSGANLEVAPLQRLLAVQGDEDLAPRVRAISGYRTWPTSIIREDDRRSDGKAHRRRRRGCENGGLILKPFSQLK